MITTKQIIEELKTKYGGVVSDDLWRGMHYIVESALHEKHIEAYMHSFYDCVAKTGVTLLVLTPLLILSIAADEKDQDIVQQAFPLSSLICIERHLIISEPEHKKLMLKMHYKYDNQGILCNPSDPLVKDFYETAVRNMLMSKE